MAEGKKSFVLYTDYVHTVCKLTDAKAGKLFKHILKFVNDENPISDDQIIELVFEPIKQNLKRDLKQWEANRSKRVDAGKQGGLKSGESRRTKANEANASKSKQNEANEAVNVNVNGIVNVTDNVNVININKKTEKIFVNVGNENYQLTPSQLANTESFYPRTEQTLMTTLSGIDTLALWEQFDKNYTCHDFDDRNHFYNSMKKIGREILKDGNNQSPKFLIDIRKK